MTRHRRSAWLWEAVVILALILLPFLFWWRLWTPDPADRAAIPQGDFTEQYYPLHLFAARELADGRLPAWDPYINAGQPGLADIQTGFHYPLNLLPNLLLALMGLSFGIEALTAQVILHYSLASLFTYLLVRHLAIRAGARVGPARFAGAIAAVTFTYSGYLTTFPVQQLTILQTAVWLPLVLFFLDRAFYRPRALPQLILAGMALACALLAGHPQTAMYVVYTTLLYGFFLVWSTRDAGPGGGGARSWLRGLGFVLAPLVLGAALAAVQLLPTIGFIVRSTRAGLDYDAVAWGFPLAEMTHLLYPGYFGGSPQYVGILSPILAAAALFLVRARREVLFWVAVGIVALLLAFGGNTFLYSVTYLLAPGFGAVRNQERIIYLFAFAISILAGYGALTLVQPLHRSVRKGFCRFGRGLGWIWLAFLALTALYYFGYLQGLQQDVAVNMFEGLLRHHVLLLLILAGAVVLFGLRRSGRVRRPWLMALALVLVWLNLFTINWRFNLAEPAAGGLYPETGLVTFLRGQQGNYRTSSAGLLPGGASAGIVYEIEDITGNTPLRLESFQQFEDGVGSWRRWQLLNVEYVLSRRDIAGPGLERVFEEDEVKVYSLTDPLPRAWMVYDTVVADNSAALALLNADDFDPRRTAVLPDEAANLVLPGGDRPGAAAQVLGQTPGKLALSVLAEDDGLLVISQPFYAGWRARVDGQPAQIHRVDFLLQGIPVGAGEHRVELDYYHSPLPAFLSVVALVVCLVGLVFFWQRAKQQAPWVMG